MVWKYEKFRGDNAIYAFCPKCEFNHNPSRYSFELKTWVIAYQYKYCPMCGKRLYDKKLLKNGAEVIWNVRNIEDIK